ncbi:MAG: sterol desaturase family protein [Magnetococcales bacterium]|nr:sterol desaturase family protein [Magnetococcales bacterium]
MEAWLLTNEVAVRLFFFFGVLGIVALWEFFAPQRQRQRSVLFRWFNNLGLVFLNSAVLRWLFPMAAVAFASVATERGWGLLNLLDPHPAFAFLVSVLLLDLAIYLQHVLFHAVPAFWRLHRVHHADVDYDVTTGARFHTIEIILSMGIKFAVIAVLGPQAVAVLVFEILLNATAMFNHGNIYLPKEIDRVLRLVVVTPDMHRVHHSVLPDECNCNFGFNLPWWDRLMGTYREAPINGQRGMIIGLSRFRNPNNIWLHRMLMIPFRPESGGYAINRRWDDVFPEGDGKKRSEGSEEGDETEGAGNAETSE